MSAVLITTVASAAALTASSNNTVDMSPEAAKIMACMLCFAMVFAVGLVVAMYCDRDMAWGDRVVFGVPALMGIITATCLYIFGV